MVLIGIDEAGRGPVLGSLFVAGVRLSDTHELLDTVEESKSISNTKVIEIAESLIEDDSVDIIVVELTPQDIAESGNITELTAQTMSNISKELHEESVGLFVDACHTSAETFSEVFDGELFNPFIVEHKADESYSCVSAAGCVAKYYRELSVENLADKYPEFEVGSGYPSDTTTRSFLKEYYIEFGEFPDEARLSWSTCDKIQESIEKD